MSRHSLAGNPTTDRWTVGYNAAVEALNALPGPLVPVFAARLLRVTADPDDDLVYDAGFRHALHQAL